MWASPVDELAVSHREKSLLIQRGRGGEGGGEREKGTERESSRQGLCPAESCWMHGREGPWQLLDA